MTADPALPEISLAVWDVPLAVAAGERFSLKIGAKSSIGSALRDRMVEVLDDAGVMTAAGQLGLVPWSGTAGLFWTEVELGAPIAPGVAAFTVRLDGRELQPPHQNASTRFSLSIVARPEHILTVTVAASGVPLEQAHVRLGALHAVTDAAGRAEIRLAKGRYELNVYKVGFDTEPVPLMIETDAAVVIEARAQPADDPDAFWTV
jgi:hypothetical protein